MIKLLFLLAGAAAGVYVRCYLVGFAQALSQQIDDYHREIFPQNRPHFCAEQLLAQSALRPISTSAPWRYRLGFALLFGAIAYLCSDWRAAAIYCVCGALLFCLSLIDWHYRLISPAQCQALAALGILGAWQQWLPLPLDTVLLSIMIAFALFYAVFYLSAWCYGREVFGRGDYWLIAGLSAFLPYYHLPYWLFAASTTALCYALWQRLCGKPITLLPFAPFLCVSAVLVGGYAVFL